METTPAKGKKAMPAKATPAKAAPAKEDSEEEDEDSEEEEEEEEGDEEEDDEDDDDDEGELTCPAAFALGPIQGGSTFYCGSQSWKWWILAELMWSKITHEQILKIVKSWSSSTIGHSCLLYTWIYLKKKKTICLPFYSPDALPGKRKKELAKQKGAPDAKKKKTEGEGKTSQQNC